MKSTHQKIAELIKGGWCVESIYSETRVKTCKLRAANNALFTEKENMAIDRLYELECGEE